MVSERLHCHLIGRSVRFQMSVSAEGPEVSLNCCRMQQLQLSQLLPVQCCVPELQAASTMQTAGTDEGLRGLSILQNSDVEFVRQTFLSMSSLSTFLSM